MLKFITVLCLSVFFYNVARSQQTTGWTKENEKQFYNTLDDHVKIAFRDDGERAKLLGCYIEKLKLKLPGGPQSVSQDSLDALFRIYFKECFEELHPTK